MFNFQRKRADSEPTVTQARIRVEGGLHPDTVYAVAGRPLRITFRREEASPCSEQVVFPALGQTLTLPTGKDVRFDWMPDMTGELEFTCGMGMLRGRLVVAPPIPAAPPAA